MSLLASFLSTMGSGLMPQKPAFPPRAVSCIEIPD
jgi:hypothetical protein